jgi:hypothetical protein
MSEQIIKQEGDKLKVPTPENHCAFHIEAVDNVCSDQFTLDKMKEFIKNLKGPNADVDNASPAQTVELAKQAVGCDSEVCLLKNPQVSQFIGPVKADEILHERFKPSGPADSTAWLNNDNIDYVLEQWAKKYPNFTHVPFQMIDFDITKTELANIDLISLYESDTRKMGCVINTDKSTGKGIHWFCVFIDMSDENKWTLEYFDSAGDYPKGSVHRWLNEQRAKLGAKYTNKDIQVVDVTKSNQLQKSTTECGVFSLWYILSRLNNIPYTYFTQPNASDDKMMYEFRRFLFRHDLKKSGGRGKIGKDYRRK